MYIAFWWSLVCALLWLVAFVEMIVTRGQGVVCRDIFLGSCLAYVVIVVAAIIKASWPWMKRNATKCWIGACWLAIFGGMWFAHTVAQADLERQHQVEIENMRHDMYVNNEVTR